MINTDTGTCTFPLCSRIVERNGFCFLHASHFAGAKPEKSKVPIAKESEKRKVINKQYRAIKNEMIGKDDRCKINSPVCTGKAQGLNHKQKRSPNNLIKVDNLENSCNPCNGYVETHVAWAKSNGHFISKFKK